MIEPALSDEETRTLIAYTRHKFAAERWPLSPALRPVREIMDKLEVIEQSVWKDLWND